MRAEEAISVLEKYLDDALLAGFASVEVIHGIGEGILRKLVAERHNFSRFVYHREDYPVLETVVGYPPVRFFPSDLILSTTSK